MLVRVSRHQLLHLLATKLLEIGHSGSSFKDWLNGSWLDYDLERLSHTSPALHTVTTLSTSTNRNINPESTPQFPYRNNHSTYSLKHFRQVTETDHVYVVIHSDYCGLLVVQMEINVSLFLAKD